MRSDEIPEISTVELQVPNFGTVTGLCLNNEVCQYLGIPYADIPGRFRRSVPVSSPWKNGKWDGTKLGPYCPQPPLSFYPLPVPPRPWLQMPVQDEFKCLNLNVSVPQLPSEGKEPLPVMVFIHGGAFTYSSSASPLYDGRIIASTSREISRPTIIVTMNYRLGAYGFLAGRDIEEYNQEHGDVGVGNYGVWDQVLALRWVKKNIAAFGGDPERITLFGQSAGGVSVHCHLLRSELLFSSAIVQSGPIRLCSVMSIDEWQTCYEKLLVELDISLDLPHQERLKQLLAVESTKMSAAMIPVFVTPVITVGLCDDNVLIPGGVPRYAAYKSFQIPEWCPRIMMGDCRNECIIWNKSWDNLEEKPSAGPLSRPSATLALNRITDHLGPEKASIIAKLYGITPDLSVEETFRALERMTSDGLYKSLIHFQEKSASSLYAYHFDVPSQFDMAWKGMAHHSHDNAMIWGILKDRFPAAHHPISDAMREAWIKFASGEEPWERFDKAQRYMIWSEDGSRLKTAEEDSGRGYEIWEKLDELNLIPDLADLSTEICLRMADRLHV